MNTTSESDTGRRTIRKLWRWRRAAASALLVGTSLALGAVAIGFGSSPGTDHVAKMHLEDISLG